jgi:phytoene synthase
MRPTEQQREIFRKGSKTYFNSSLFFPSDVRNDVFALYAFVRVADNYVDSVPQEGERFYAFRNAYRAARKGGSSGDTIIDSFVELERRLEFPPDWADGFFHSMELDLTKNVYATVEESLEYVYGSAEVIGLFMSRIMRLDSSSDHAARMLGRSMQFINFIRDIDEDNGLGRIYLPIGETDLNDLMPATVQKRPDEFVRFLTAQLDRYRKWQAAAEGGYRHIPHRYLIAIKTAADMYNWTAAQIAADPIVVYDRKVKPSRGRILRGVIANVLSSRSLSRDGHHD